MRASPLMLAPVLLLAALSLSPAQEAVEQPAAVNPNPLSSLDLESLNEKIRTALRKHFDQETGKRPMILPVILEV